MSEFRIGISGWRYGPWRGTFYPKALPQKRELAYASRRLNSIEINGSFYSLQRPEYYRQWYDETPDDFVFSVKGGRFITHMKKLRDIDEALANFFASGVLALEEKLGPILWQFPPGFALNMERFEQFFELLPRDTQGAARLAKRHGRKLKGRVYTKTEANRPLRHAVEVRHPSFLVPPFIKLLRRHNIAFVFADTAGLWPYTEDVTNRSTSAVIRIVRWTGGPPGCAPGAAGASRRMRGGRWTSRASAPAAATSMRTSTTT
jgi:uncharacterized protein YecE (DUF72 family)